MASNKLTPEQMVALMQYAIEHKLPVGDPKTRARWEKSLRADSTPDAAEKRVPRPRTNVRAFIFGPKGTVVSETEVKAGSRNARLAAAQDAIMKDLTLLQGGTMRTARKEVLINDQGEVYDGWVLTGEYDLVSCLPLAPSEEDESEEVPAEQQAAE